VVFSPDGKRVVSGSGDKTIRIWDAQTGNPVSQPWEGHTDQVWSVAFSPNGKRVVSGSSDKTIYIWDAQTSNPVLQPLEAIKAISSGHPVLVHGWIQGPEQQLICWIPPTNRIRLTMFPQALVVIGHHWTKVGRTKFVHGPSWQQCVN
jgi:WD40 repeat protein